MMTVFRDILPGYKIRKLTEQELEVKVTKGVQKTRDFEMTLLKAFQAYLKLLRSIATSETAPLAHGRCAYVDSGAQAETAVSHRTHNS